MNTTLDEMVSNLTRVCNTDGAGYVVATLIKDEDEWNIYTGGSMGFRIDVIYSLISNVFEHIPSREVCNYVTAVIGTALRQEVEKANKREAAE